MNITQPTTTSFSHHNFLPLLAQISQQRFLLAFLKKYHSSQRHFYYKVATLCTMFFLLPPTLARRRPKTPLMFKVIQTASAPIGNNIDASTISSIPTIRTTKRHKLLMAKTDYTISTISTMYYNVYSIH
jgi:hypothetical protein